MGHPLKGPLSRNKLSHLRKNWFFPYKAQRNYLPPCLRLSASFCIPYFFGRMSVISPLHQSPIRIKAICIKHLWFIQAPFRLSAEPENLRYQTVSNRYISQILWLLANPLLVHGMGSKETENHWVERLPIKSDGFANPLSGSPFQPILKQKVSVDQMPPGLSSHSMPPVPVCVPAHCAPP